MEFNKFKKKHVRDVLSWIKNEQEMVIWAGPVFTWPITQKQFHLHLKEVRSKQPTLYPFGLYDHSKLVGYCELFNYNRNSNSAVVSRVLISPKKRYKGLGQLMLRQLLEFGFNDLNLNRIGLGVFDFNAPAIVCYKKIGFKNEGTLRESSKVGDEYWNCHMMSILKKEWKNSLK